MKQILLGSLLLLLFSACSPRIGTSITKIYPPLSAESPITVYLYQTEVPSGAESLGRISISDTGFTVVCDSATVMNRVKDEARKIGGNAVCITDHKKPLFWGSSCHQMTAIILKVKDFDQSSDFVDNSAEVQSAFSVTKSTLPKIKVGANAGYGWRTAKLSSNVQGDIRDFEKKLMSGISWDGSFHYYFNDTYGLGLLYSSFLASNSEYGSLDGVQGTLSIKRAITFVGPAFAIRGATSDKKWFLNFNIGIGYLGYNTNETFKGEYTNSNKHFKGNGSTVGVLINWGGEYKFNKNWGIGVDLTSVAGILNELNVIEDGYRSTYVFEDGQEEGIGQFRLTTGLRYYFK